MQRQATWRALAITYAVVAGMQVFLAVSMNAAWAWALGAAFALSAVGFGFAAWRARQLPADDGLTEHVTPAIVLVGKARNTVNSPSDLRSTY
jgi:hypothetical protein